MGKSRTPVSGTLTVGRRGDNAGDGYHVRGVVDELQVYDRPLAAAEIAQLHDDPATSSRTTPRRTWSFDPAGVERDRRATAQWKDAALSLRLKTLGQTLEKRVTQSAGATWTLQDPGHVALAVEFTSAAPSLCLLGAAWCNPTCRLWLPMRRPAHSVL